MKLLPKIILIAVGSFSLAALVPAHAQILVTEVDPTGSSNSTYAADWFELTNTGSSAVNISGWKMDDNSDSFGSAVSLNGITSIAAGQSVIFIEGDSTTASSFTTAWFGSSVPSGFAIGYYSGSGVGLSSSADEVNIFNASGTKIAGVGFGVSTTGKSFDNAAGLNSTTSTDPTLTTVSAAGVHGAFNSVTGGEVGSPGTIGVTPEPSTYALMIGGFLTLIGFQVLRRNKIA